MINQLIPAFFLSSSVASLAFWRGSLSKSGVFGALLSVPILLMLTALFDHIGRPNLVGFIFGEPLFTANLFDEEDTAEQGAE